MRTRKRPAGIKIIFWDGVGWVSEHQIVHTYGAASRDQNYILGRDEVGFGVPDSAYVRWKSLDTSGPIENHLLKKVAGHMRKVVDLANSAKSC